MPVGRDVTMDLDELIADLAAEQDALAGVLTHLPAHAWDLPTHARGWAVRDQVAHLAATDEAATLAIRDPAGFVEAARQGRTGMVTDSPSFLDRARGLPAAGVLAWWQE